MEILKIRLKTLKIFTVTVSKKTDDHIYGTDKDGISVKLKIDDIDSMIPWRQEDE